MTHNHNSPTQLSKTPVLATTTTTTINNNLQFVYLLLYNDVTTGYSLCTLS